MSEVNEPQVVDQQTRESHQANLELADLASLTDQAFRHVGELRSMIGDVNDITNALQVQHLSKHYRNEMFDMLIKESSELTDLLKLISKKAKKIKRVKLSDDKIDALIVKKVDY